MQSLKFKQLLVLSNSEKSANQFNFHDHLNLITADDNTVGKSTIVKLLFWTLGCEPSLDSSWKNLECKTLLRFAIGTNHYEIMRDKHLIYFSENGGEIKLYPKLTGDFAKLIAGIFEFSALLPNRNNDNLEVPPPAYYFVPFYIDQKRSWSKAWDNFDGLGQYSNWKSTIIKYHIGLLTPKHFELETDKNNISESKKAINVELEKIDTTLEVVEKYIPKINTTIDDGKFLKMADEIRLDLKKLSDHQETVLDNLSKLESDKAFLLHQKDISEKIVQELDKDYEFTIEKLSDDHVECPLCGSMHENSIVNRASILTDKYQAERQLVEINGSLESITKKILLANDDLHKTRSNINEINAKYLLNDGETTSSLSDIIENIAGNAIKFNVSVMRNNKLLESLTLEDKIKEISKEQKDILTKEEKEKISNFFIQTFVSYIKLLDAEGVNISEIKSPLDYSKIVKEGGAAEGTRAILAYYLTIYSLIEEFGHGVKAPLIIDTPNQQEQSSINYSKILDLFNNKLSANAQIFICALNNEHLKPLKEKAKTITLNKDKIMNKNLYDAIAQDFEKYLSITIPKENEYKDKDDDNSEFEDVALS